MHDPIGNRVSTFLENDPLDIGSNYMQVCNLTQLAGKRSQLPRTCPGISDKVVFIKIRRPDFRGG
jgi:hypothetical protein